MREGREGGKGPRDTGLRPMKDRGIGVYGVTVWRLLDSPSLLSHDVDETGNRPSPSDRPSPVVVRGPGQIPPHSN